MSKISKELLQRVMPSQYKGNVTDEMVDNVNQMITDPNFRELYRDNLVSFTSVLQDGKYQVQKYVEAVKFVSHKLTGDSDVAAYTKTFPDRYQRLVDEGADAKTISAYVSAYKKNQLVTKILEQTLVPVHIMNADLFQKAVNQQAYLMMNANSEKVASDAAACLIRELRPPEAKKVELDIGVKEDKGLNELRAATQELVRMQKQQLEAKVLTPQQVAQTKLIEAEVVDE